MRAFRIVGPLLLVLLLGWIALSLLARPGQRPAPEVLGIGSAFEGNLQLPFETIKAAFDDARAKMLDVNQIGSSLRLVGDIGGWLSFAATCAITLIVGFYGRRPAGVGAITDADTQGLSKGAIQLIGLLASLAAVLTALGNMSTAKSQDYFNRADHYREVINKARPQVIGASNAESAQAVLDDLTLQIAR